MQGIVSAARTQNQLNSKHKGDYPCKYTRKNRICPRLLGKPVHVDKISTKTSLQQDNMEVVNAHGYIYRRRKRIVKPTYVRTDNYNCKQRRNNNRLILLSAA